jgi:adenylyltransferase/sulfurtransferase
VVDSSNLQRQVIHSTSGLGELKVESARQRMLDLNPYIQVDAYNEILTSENAERISSGYDLIVDGTDNFPTRYLINDLCVLTHRPYVYGSIFRFEGQISVFDSRSGPCYRCLFPEPPPPGMVPSCAEGGVFGVLPGTIGTMQATEVIKLILGIGEPLTGKLLLYDALDMTFQVVTLRKNPNCMVCGEHPTLKELIDYEEFCGVPAREDHIVQLPSEMEIGPREVAEKLAGGEPLVLLDVRDPVEREVSQLPGELNIPLGLLPSRLEELDPQAEIVVFCRTGARSSRAIKLLACAGFTRAKNMVGGINAWAREVDSSLKQY